MKEREKVPPAANMGVMGIEHLPKCVCVREKDRQRERERKRGRYTRER